MKVFIFSDTHWALGRIHRDVMKQLNYEVRYTDWSGYSLQEFMDNYIWCDRCITNLVAYNALKPSFPMLDLSKCIFVSHGAVEHENITYEPQLTYGMVSDCLKDLFPEFVTPLLMPNGVDPDSFTYTQRDGNLSNLGWCGAPHVASKQVEWAHDISNQTNIPLNLATNLTYDEVKEWYQTIDLLIVTAVPIAYKETGPLPPFEAIVSGVPVIGTPVGNFRHIPGPKFKTVEEAVNLINHFKQHPEELKELAKIQYDFVVNNFSYKVLAPYWSAALTAKNGNNQS